MRNNKYSSYLTVEGYKKARLDSSAQSLLYGDSTADANNIQNGVAAFQSKNPNDTIALNFAPDKGTALFNAIYSVIGK